MTMDYPPDPKQVAELCVSDYPMNERTRLLIEIAENGLSNPVCVPVVVARGKVDGPTFGITAALHGNELNGIPLLHELLRKVNLNRLRGTIVAVLVANIPGLLAEQREFTDGKDLNHIMPGKRGGNASQAYAYGLMSNIIDRFDFLVDLHTASFGRVNSLYVRADMSNQTTARMARLLRPQIILHDPPSDYTMRGAVAEQGVPAVTVEIRDPHRFQPESIRRSLTGVMRILSELQMLPPRKPADAPAPIVCDTSYWIYTDCGGFLNVLPDVTDKVEKGDVIARQYNAFGDLVREYLAPEAGVVIGRSTNPISQTGARILHLGRLDTDGYFDPNA
jgi:predicted deacylase